MGLICFTIIFRGFAERGFEGELDFDAKIGEALNIPSSMFTTFLGKGRDVRKVTIPIIRPSGEAWVDKEDDTPIFRAHAYIHPDYAQSIEKIGVVEECVRELLKIET